MTTLNDVVALIPIFYTYIFLILSSFKTNYDFLSKIYKANY